MVIAPKVEATSAKAYNSARYVRVWHILFIYKSMRDSMAIKSLILILIIGAVAGWLAGKIMKGRGFGAVGNIVVGILGAVLGKYLFGLLGIWAGGLVGSLITATVGAIVLLYVVGLLKKL